MIGVGGVRKSIDQSWLAKELGLWLLHWSFKGIQEAIPSEEASTPPGRCTSPQLHPCHRLFDQDGHQDSSSPSYSPDLAPSDFWLFPKLRGCRYETIQAVTKVIDTLTQEDIHVAFQKSLEQYNKYIAARGDRFKTD